MRDVDRDLYSHLEKCLGLEGRLITKLNIYCDVHEPIRIVTAEIVKPGDLLPVHRTFQLKEIEGDE
jgi:hypothetical protein